MQPYQFGVQGVRGEESTAARPADVWGEWTLIRCTTTTSTAAAATFPVVTASHCEVNTCVGEYGCIASLKTCHTLKGYRKGKCNDIVFPALVPLPVLSTWNLKLPTSTPTHWRRLHQSQRFTPRPQFTHASGTRLAPRNAMRTYNRYAFQTIRNGQRKLEAGPPQAPSMLQTGVLVWVGSGSQCASSAVMSSVACQAMITVR